MASSYKYAYYGIEVHMLNLSTNKEFTKGFNSQDYILAGNFIVRAIYGHKISYLGFSCDGSAVANYLSRRITETQDGKRINSK